VAYRYVPGIDYGPRAGTLGFAVHMAEGGDGTLPYLARRAGETRPQWIKRVRGVSANFVILSDGEIVQMVGWTRASGSMNPNDRGPLAGFYNGSVLRSVLGAHYTDPNAWSLSVEITGYRAKGPNAAQLASLIELVAESRRRFPQMVGAYGHADQTDTKGCPGKALNMMRAWGTFGHGPFLAEDDVLPIYGVPGRWGARIREGQALREGPGESYPKVTTANPDHIYELVGANDPGGNATYYLLDHTGASGSTVPMTWVNGLGIAERVNLDELPGDVEATVIVAGTYYRGVLVR
jgi:hypothetical protein